MFEAGSPHQEIEAALQLLPLPVAATAEESPTRLPHNHNIFTLAHPTSEQTQHRRSTAIPIESSNHFGLDGPKNNTGLKDGDVRTTAKQHL